MVKLINKKNVKKFAHFAYLTYRFQEFFTHIKEVNNPKMYPCIYAMWHAHQFCIHGLPDRNKTNVLISRSRDGEIIANVVEKWGFKTTAASFFKI